MLSANQLVPFHRSANMKSGVKSIEDPAAMQTRLDVHETALRPPAPAPLGRLGNGSSDQRIPSQRSASGIGTRTVSKPSGLNELGLYSPTATQTLLEVHDTPASELSARLVSFAGSGSGVGCIRQRLPSQPIAEVPAAGPTNSSVVPTAVQNLADTHDTPETMPGGNGVARPTRPGRVPDSRPPASAP